MNFKNHCKNFIFLDWILRAGVCLAIFSGIRLEADDNKGAPEGSSLSAAFVNSMAVLNDEHKLVPGDQLSFRVIEDEDPSKRLTITDSGEVEVPYLGRMNVTGKTCRSAAGEIKAALEKQLYIRATVILCLDTMAAKGAASRGKIYLMGQVRQQGPMEIPGDEDFTVSRAILRAGGFGEYANKRKVKLIRRAGKNGTGETKIIDLVEVLEKGRGDKDVSVQPEDLIIVTERLINF